MLALDGHIATHPKHGGRFHALMLGREPHGVATIVAAIGTCHLVAQRELHALFTIPKGVGDDAMMVGSESSRQRVVVGERFARERWLHHGFDALARQLVHERHVVCVQIVPSQSVKRNNHGVSVATCCQCLPRQHG